MSRRVASQVHKQASRLLRQGYLKREPAWYQAILDHPPLPLPPKTPPARTEYDLPTEDATSPSTSAKHSKSHKNLPSPVQYLEDTVRKQFFNDHPFEAFRAVTLVEGAAIEDEHPIRGKDWVRLRQRGRNPTPEDAIRYAVNLHEHHEVPLTKAYSAAVAQFRSLRSEHDVAKKFALLEVEHYGIAFGPSQVEITFAKEERAFESWRKNEELDAGENAAKKRWRAIVEREGPPGSWTKGQEYVRLWQEGIRPTYAPLLTERKITSSGLTGVPSPPKSGIPEQERAVRSADWMTVRSTLQ
ncbi:hypothetical protein WOLCODRAFT_112765 [Wolfiporia cocos MD-104 SS10]|uniref:Small ribosomal subunit protein mS23 n=1 Tax=Wolfiporia cocos (strain MD-104) TaxID=742152 RepID=A0A2H3J2A9_WOLCO|nr:hypothetical protein WOLCODRAFT_112765 [Wolfiporia cocos MD-104 SS10]